MHLVCSLYASIKRGIPYHGSIITRAATPMKELRQRYNNVQTTLEIRKKSFSFVQQST